MSNFPNVSVILFARTGRTNAQIWDAVRTLGNSNWRAQVLIVDPMEILGSGERVTFRPVPSGFPNLKTAIESAKHDHVLIVDPETTFKREQWELLSSRAKTTPIQSSYVDFKARSKTTNLLLWFYTLLVRILFRTGKHDARPGMTLLKKSSIEAALAELPSTRNKTSDVFEATKLLAFCRLNGQAIEESSKASLDRNNTHSTKDLLRRCRYAIRVWWNSIMFPTSSSNPNAQAETKRTRLGVTVLLTMLAAFIFFGNLNYPLFEPDEARNSQLALNVLESGDWLSLSLRNESYWDKPPLQIWMIAASYSMFGESPFATRFPVALTSLLTVLLLLTVAKRLVGFQAAALGSIILLLCGGFVVTGRYVTMDASLTLLATTTFLLGYLATVATTRRRQRKYLLVAGIACGLGIMVKGPVILVLCGPPLLLNLWLNPQSKSIRWRWFCIPIALVASPWFVATSIVHPDFISYFFWKHHVVRFSEAFNHREPVWYYWIGIFLFMFPASYLLPSLVKFLTSRKSEFRSLRTREMGFLFISAIWIVGFFSISEAKLPTYIVPAFPMICLLMGVMLEKRIFSAATASEKRNTFLERLVPRVPAELLFWSTVCLLAIYLLFPDHPTSLYMTVLTLVAIGTLVGLAIKKSDSPKIAWSAFGIIALCIVTLMTQKLAPAIAVDRSIYAAARDLQIAGEFENAPIVFYGRESYGSKLSLNQNRLSNYQTEEIGDVVEFLSAHPLAIIVSSEEQIKLLRNGLPWTITLEEEQGRHIYLSRPNPAVARHDLDETLTR